MSTSTNLPNPIQNTTDQNLDSNLSEAQEYYLGLFEKWQKMSKDEQVKIDQPELWEELQKVDFEEEIKKYNVIRFYTQKELRGFLDISFFIVLSNIDKEIKEIEIKSVEINGYNFTIISEIYCDNLNINKNINLKTKCNFNNCCFNNVNISINLQYPRRNQAVQIAMSSGNVYIKSRQSGIIDISDSCNFDKLGLENYDISNFNIDTRKYLLELNSQNKLELINCNFPELDNIILQNELDTIKNNNNQLQQIFDFSSKIPKEYWEPFATYFSGFKSFIKRAKGKSLGMENNINGDFVFRVYSDDSNDLVGIEQDLNDFISAITYYSGNQFENYQKIQNGESVSINNLVMEGKVNQLIQEIKYLELENKTLRNFVSIFPEILQNIQESISQNYTQNQLLLATAKQNIIYTEGKTDVDYLKTAIKVLGYTDLDNVEIQEVGYEVNKNVYESGCGGLDNYWKSNKNKLSYNLNKITLLYDCDQKLQEENIDQKMFKVKINQNPNNQKYKVGIENLLPEIHFDNPDFCNKRTTTDPNTGKKTTTEELDKMKLCQYICNQQLTEDFQYFEPILNKLTTIFKLQP